MKKNVLRIALVALVMLFSVNGNAQKFSKLDKSPMDAAAYPSSYKESNKLVKVVYSRPQLKGRALSNLAPEGKVWRTGANEAAEITFYKDVVFGGKNVKAGTYTLFTIPGKKEWTVILSTAKNVWGSYFYKEKEDVVRVIGNVTKNKISVEAFSIAFEEETNGTSLHLGWGKTLVSIAITE